MFMTSFGLERFYYCVPFIGRIIHRVHDRCLPSFMSVIDTPWKQQSAVQTKRTANERAKPRNRFINGSHHCREGRAGIERQQGGGMSEPIEYSLEIGVCLGYMWSHCVLASGGLPKCNRHAKAELRVVDS